MTRTIQLRHVCVSASGLMNLQAALINRGTTRMPSKEGVNSTLVSNPVPVGSTIYVQTLGTIRIQLYHQCFEQVWQHIKFHIDHRSFKVDTTPSIFEGRHIDRRSSKVDTSIINLRRSTHRSSKIEGGNIAPTTQHRADIPTIRHRILSTKALHNYYT